MARHLIGSTIRSALGKLAAETALTITGATNATPIVLTVTAHGLSSGDFVSVSAVGGNTNANAAWPIVKVDANSFSLTGSVGNSAYTSGGRAQRIKDAKTYGDIDDLQAASTRVKILRGTDANRGSEVTVESALAGIA